MFKKCNISIQYQFKVWAHFQIQSNESVPQPLAFCSKPYHPYCSSILFYEVALYVLIKKPLQCKCKLLNPSKTNSEAHSILQSVKHQCMLWVVTATLKYWIFSTVYGHALR